MLRNEPAQFSDRIEAERDCRKRALRSDLIDPTIAVHHRKVVKRTGDGILVEFRSVVDAVRCAVEIQNGVVERNVGLPPERRIETVSILAIRGPSARLATAKAKRPDCPAKRRCRSI
jgi:class 3 adenylate cyclase